MNTSRDRALREKETYDKGLERSIYNSIFSHCTYYTNLIKEQFLINEMKNHVDGKVLEIGCDCWYGWLHNMDFNPKDIHALNISSTEVHKGMVNLDKTQITPTFYIMDANNLAFSNNKFDLIFGGALLHHLELPIALKEIQRVLKPGGKFIFWEPLRLNPVAILIRAITPKYRTKDERPFGIKELNLVRKHFDMHFIPFEFFSTPIGVISKLLFKNPNNFLMKTAYKVNRILLKIFPPLSDQ